MWEETKKEKLSQDKQVMGAWLLEDTHKSGDFERRRRRTIKMLLLLLLLLVVVMMIMIMIIIII